MSTQVLGLNSQQEEIIWTDNLPTEQQTADAQLWLEQNFATVVGNISGVDAIWRHGYSVWEQFQACQDWAAALGYQCSFYNAEGRAIFWKTGLALDQQSQEAQDWIAENNVFFMPITAYNPEGHTLDAFWRQGKTIAEQDADTQFRYWSINAQLCGREDTREKPLKPDGTEYDTHVWRTIKMVFLYNALDLKMVIDISYPHEFGTEQMIEDFTETFTLSTISNV